ncbi:MAG: VCBS repeat-containing protein [Ruminococcaceae bacterium]|nr:VCBS repeat-containing protein [Oscillospiraceae bacterium]
MRSVLRAAALAALLCGLLLLCGCMPGSFDDLYRLPRLPAEYESLETLIDALLDGGVEYAAPTSGSNLQSVQMVDLNGDGEEEAVACFRRASDERPMKIYVFRAVNDSYEQYCVLEGTSSSIYSLNYVDLNGDGWRELLVGIRSDLDVQNLAVYSVASPEPQLLLVTGYSRYAAQDLDGDGRQDVIVLRSDEENSTVADYYVWDGAELALRSSLRLSSTIAELGRFSAGTLAEGRRALFVTAVAEDNAAIVDIVTAEDGTLRSVKSSASGEKFRFLELYPSDVNGDGVTEVPEPIPFPQLDPEGTVYYRIRWRQYDAAGDSAVVRETYQDTQGGWSLTLPEGWDQNVTVSRSVSADGSAVTFMRIDGTEPEPFLTIHAFTGYNRTALASRGGRILLSNQAEITYAAEIYYEGAGMIDEQTLRESFNLIMAEWTTGEN